MTKQEELSCAVMELIGQPQTVNELIEKMDCIAFTLGGMVCYVDREERSQVLMHLTEALGIGLQVTAKNIGEPSDIEIVVGQANGY